VTIGSAGLHNVFCVRTYRLIQQFGMRLHVLLILKFQLKTLCTIITYDCKLTTPSSTLLLYFCVITSVVSIILYKILLLYEYQETMTQVPFNTRFSVAQSILIALNMVKTAGSHFCIFKNPF